MIRAVYPRSGFFTHPGSRIQGSKRDRIPDPQHLSQKDDSTARIRSWPPYPRPHSAALSYTSAISTRMGWIISGSCCGRTPRDLPLNRGIGKKIPAYSFFKTMKCAFFVFTLPTSLINFLYFFLIIQKLLKT
jgi:hypothetical protein